METFTGHLQGITIDLSASEKKLRPRQNYRSKVFNSDINKYIYSTSPAGNFIDIQVKGRPICSSHILQVIYKTVKP